MTYDSRFEAELAKLATERVAHLVGCLINRSAVPDIASYNFLVGQIEALRVILPEICTEANQSINGSPETGV